MSITDVILRVSAKRMRDFETVGQYSAEYDGAFNQIKGMLVDGAKVNIASMPKGFELSLEREGNSLPIDSGSCSFSGLLRIALES